MQSFNRLLYFEYSAREIIGNTSGFAIGFFVMFGNVYKPVGPCTLAHLIFSTYRWLVRFMWWRMGISENNHKQQIICEFDIV